jgi:hypothetical protein
MQRSTRPRPSQRQRLLLAYLVLWLAMPFGVLGNWNSETTLLRDGGKYWAVLHQ